ALPPPAGLGSGLPSMALAFSAGLGLGPLHALVVTALGNTWHPEHFVCTHCQKEMGGSNFFEKDGAPYCERDYFQLFSPRCGLCNEPILDVSWPHCAHLCYAPFLQGSFFEHGGRPFCETHYHKQRGSLCWGCEKPIAGRCITAMARKFHPEHFVCAFCLKQLNKGTFKEQNDKPYCHPCFLKKEQASSLWGKLLPRCTDL
uniref:Transforming growth factor beta 1 induced transcript 1 n=1 Tax=Chelonoidis abingdonii TaxID=106734 RepID=A0A8C0GAR6_CHEAB